LIHTAIEKTADRYGDEIVASLGDAIDPVNARFHSEIVSLQGSCAETFERQYLFACEVCPHSRLSGKPVPITIGELYKGQFELCGGILTPTHWADVSPPPVQEPEIKEEVWQDDGEICYVMMSAETQSRHWSCFDLP
jgi:hypothetical protein